MSLSVEDRLENSLVGFITARRVKKLLRVVPREHLIGLEKIVILNEIRDKKKRRVGGIYREKSNEQPCSIELAIDRIYHGMPRILFFLPFAANFSLADVLYHEIGHHYHKIFTHGVKQHKQEHFAENYSKEMVKRRFKWWSFVFMPLAPFIRYLHKKVKGREE